MWHAHRNVEISTFLWSSFVRISQISGENGEKISPRKYQQITPNLGYASVEPSVMGAHLKYHYAHRTHPERLLTLQFVSPLLYGMLMAVWYWVTLTCLCLKVLLWWKFTLNALSTQMREVPLWDPHPHLQFFFFQFICISDSHLVPVYWDYVAVSPKMSGLVSSHDTEFHILQRVVYVYSSSCTSFMWCIFMETQMMEFWELKLLFKTLLI